jgi:hypothetical protein
MKINYINMIHACMHEKRDKCSKQGGDIQASVKIKTHTHNRKHHRERNLNLSFLHTYIKISFPSVGHWGLHPSSFPSRNFIRATFSII